MSAFKTAVSENRAASPQKVRFGPPADADASKGLTQAWVGFGVAVLSMISSIFMFFAALSSVPYLSNNLEKYRDKVVTHKSFLTRDLHIELTYDQYIMLMVVFVVMALVAVGFCLWAKNIRRDVPKEKKDGQITKHISGLKIAIATIVVLLLDLGLFLA